MQICCAGEVTVELAQQHHRAILPLCDTVLLTLEDETALWDLHTEAQQMSAVVVQHRGASTPRSPAATTGVH